MHPNDSIEIPLSRGRTAYVDPEDADLAELSWYFRYGTPRTVGYALRRVRGLPRGQQQFERMHRVVMARVLGRALLDAEIVDHIDRDRLNNRRSNLRLVTASQNGINAKLPINNRTGVKGVYRKRQKFAACIRKDRKLVYLGCFDRLEDAAAARDEAERLLFPELVAGAEA